MNKRLRLKIAFAAVGCTIVGAITTYYFNKKIPINFCNATPYFSYSVLAEVDGEEIKSLFAAHNFLRAFSPGECATVYVSPARKGKKIQYFAATKTPFFERNSDDSAIFDYVNDLTEGCPL